MLGLICELHAGGSCHSYTISASDHHHLICSNCSMVVDFTGYDLGQLEQKLSLDTGFDIEPTCLSSLVCARLAKKKRYRIFIKRSKNENNFQLAISKAKGKKPLHRKK